MDGRGIGNGIIGSLIVLAIMTFGAGALTVWGLPKLWELVKPLIHALTA